MSDDFGEITNPELLAAYNAGIAATPAITPWVMEIDLLSKIPVDLERLPNAKERVAKGAKLYYVHTAGSTADGDARKRDMNPSMPEGCNNILFVDHMNGQEMYLLRYYH